MSVLKTKLNQNQKAHLFEFTNGISYDQKMAKEEIEVQKAWVLALEKQGYFSKVDSQSLLHCFETALEKMLSGDFPWSIEDEDIHMNLERYITQELGELGQRIHLGRSRNDLVATTLRLYCANQNQLLLDKVKGLQKILADLSGRCSHLIIPGMTHYQNGMPIYLKTWLDSYLEELNNSYKGFLFSKDQCLELLPLGAAAFGESPVKLDLSFVAKSLGFQNPEGSSVYKVGDRSFLLSSFHGLSLLSISMKKICQDFIYWASSNISLLKLPPNYSTGSSIMPNKRNPDVLELIRAKSSKILGLEMSVKNLYSAVGSSYHSDLHELKKIYMDALEEIHLCLDILGLFLEEVEFSEKKASQMLNQGHLLATDIAYDLVGKGLSFRQAYQKVAQLVQEANEKNLQVHELYDQDSSQGIFKKFLDKRVGRR